MIRFTDPAIRRRRRLEAAAMLAAICVGSARPGAAQASEQPRSIFLGSVPAAESDSTPLRLSVKDTFDRALKCNLGILEGAQDVRAARALRLRGLNALLPDVSAQLSGSRQQINLAASGSTFSIPGLSVPTVVGPFNVADVRIYVSQQVFNWSDIKHWQSTTESERASQYASQDDRELVIMAAGRRYLTVIADHATVDSTRAQLATGQALHERAVDRNSAGVIASIDVLRARVQLQTQQQQRLIAAENHSRPLLRGAIVVLVLVAVAVAGVAYWRSRAWESTDNAQIDGFVFPVSSRVSGHVLRVMVDDNQYVEAGTVLVQLDPKDYEVAVAIAEGKLANDEASAAALITGVPITSTDTAATRASRLAARSCRTVSSSSAPSIPSGSGPRPSRPKAFRSAASAA